MRKWSMVLFILLFSLAAKTGWAEDTQSEIQKTISAQIMAFLDDDQDAAYSFAAPGIKARFASKEAFFAMVKKGYQPVYRPGNYAFGRYKELDPGVMAFQEVLISAPDGKDWTAVYKLVHQSDGSWKIGGVGMFPNKKSKGI